VVRRPLNTDGWAKALPSITAWAGVGHTLAACGDPDMQIHVLRKGDVFYVAACHTEGSHNDYQIGEWSGTLRFLHPLTPRRYRVHDIWLDRPVGTFEAAELAAGFDAGRFENKQMKIFRIAPSPTAR
jgi:hypothetical protein